MKLLGDNITYIYTSSSFTAVMVGILPMGQLHG